MSAFLALDFWMYVLVLAGIYSIFSLGLQVQYGVAGLLNFGHVGMMALSSYSLAILVIKVGLNMWLACVVAVAIAALGGALLGLTTLRLRGDYFAIVTTAFSEIVRYVANNQRGLTGGTEGSIAITGKNGLNSFSDTFENFRSKFQDFLQHIIGDYAQNRDTQMAILIWLLAFVLLFLVGRLEKTPWARVLRATREDDYVPAALSKNVFKFRLYALVIGSIIGGIAGVCWALQFTFVSPTDFMPLTTFYAWIIMILAGATRVRGIPIGAIIFTFLFAGVRLINFPPFSWLTSGQQSYLRLVIIGLVLIWLMLRRPQGIFGKKEEMVLE
jgi:branched-chain amino acid transport system permease protein